MNSSAILLVEDDPDDEILTLRALKMSNIQNKVIVVHDGAEVLDFLFCRNIYTNRDPDDMPKLILLNSKLPKVDGLEVLRRLRADQRTHLLPIVIFNSSNDNRELRESYKRGANSCLHKPVDFNQFMGYIRQLSLYWLELNEPPPRERPTKT